MWRRECVQSFEHNEKGGQSQSSSILIRYNRASRVHAIMGTLDRKPVCGSKTGWQLSNQIATRKRCVVDRCGKSAVDVSWPHIYNLVKTDSPEVHEVEIICHGADFLFFTFVFG
jgi:hypothetical protein